MASSPVRRGTRSLARRRFATVRVACGALVLGVLLGLDARASVVSWQVKQDPSTPGPRFAHAATFDSARKLTVIFGGLAGNVVQGDTWGWDGTTWTRLASADATDPNRPSPRYDTAMAYYVKPGGGDGILLFGGRDATNTPQGDTFEWNGATRTWTRVSTTGPSARFLHALAYDAAIKQVVLFGGADASANGLAANQTWGWDGTQWKLLTAGLPAERAAHSLVYDEDRQRVVLFGGFESFVDVLGDTWEFDGTNWKRMCIPQPCDIPPRFFHAATYDGFRKRVVLLGGLDSLGTTLGDTWLWDGKAWTVVPGEGSSPARTRHAMAFDASRKRDVLYGGFAGPGGLADTREAFFAGQPCSSAAECQTGFCVDGVCCRSACTGTCRRCDLGRFVLIGPEHVARGPVNGACSSTPFGQDPDHECGGESGCDGGCGPGNRCEFPTADKPCGLCAACNPGTGRCDQLPASGDDVNCPPARCSLASHPCRMFFDQSTDIRRCLTVGSCGWRWEDCSSFQDHDGASCSTFVDPGQDVKVGSCAGGLCVPP